LGPVKLAFARRIGAVPRSRRAIPTIAVTFRCRAVEATFRRSVIPGVRSWRPALAGLRAPPAVGSVKLAFARGLGAVTRSRRAFSTIAGAVR
jgi:hypothetical protein